MRLRKLVITLLLGSALLFAQGHQNRPSAGRGCTTSLGVFDTPSRLNHWQRPFVLRSLAQTSAR
jgi:hypothetical protein